MKWWKIASIVLLLYTFVAGLLIPLKPGLTDTTPDSINSGTTASLTLTGYNTRFDQADPQQSRVWLRFDSAHILFGRNLKALDAAHLQADFQFPAELPVKGEKFARFDVYFDDPVNGLLRLENEIQVAATATPDSNALASGSGWATDTIKNVHRYPKMSFPILPNIYESGRNLYYHVPMWFAMILLFGASVWFSIRNLSRPSAHNDRRAKTYAETGLLFGLLGLTTGMLWATFTWGKPWNNDIKQIMTAVALLIYFAYFILRNSFDDQEKGARLAAVYNVFAFSTLIPLLYIVPRLEMFESLHPGAKGSPTFSSQDLDNTMRMVFYPAILGWTMLGFWVADIRIRVTRLQDHLQDID